jgi:uncharacterized protein YcfJ
MGKAIKFTLLGAALGAGAVAMRARGGESSGDMPAKAAKGAGCGALAGGLVGMVFDRRSKRKLKTRMNLAAMVNAGALVEAARAARPAIEKQSRRARKAAERAAKEAGRKARKARRKAVYAVEATRDSAGHLVEAGRHKLAS